MSQLIRSNAPLRAFKDHTAAIWVVAVLPDRWRMVTNWWDSKTLRLWDLKTSEMLKKMEGHRADVNTLAVSRDGQMIASGDVNGELIAWHGETGESLMTQPIKAHSECISWLDFSPDGTILVTGSRDGTTKLWNTKTWQPQGDPMKCSDCIRCVRYSSSGKHLAIATNSNIEIYNSSTRERVTNFKGHAVWNFSLAWTPDDTRLLSGGDTKDPSIREWDTATWKQVGDPWTGHAGCIYSIAIHPAGTYVASVSDDNHIRIWRFSDRQSIAMFQNSGWVGCVEYILSRGSNNMISDGEVPKDTNSEAQVSDLKINTTAEELFVQEITNLNNAIRKLREQYVDLSEIQDLIRNIINVQLNTAPLRLLNTTVGLVCARELQVRMFKASVEYKELRLWTMKHPGLQTKRIAEAVAAYFRFVMLSHRWEAMEPLLRDIQDKVVFKLKAAGGLVKLQSFCKIARDAGYHWAWVDTCCIDKYNNVELQASLNSMFVWYRYSALTVVYLADVPPSSKSGALAKSAWNTRGFTLPEFLAPKIIRFYQQDWSLYLDDDSPNHKESVRIMEELENATGIDARSVVAFQPGMRDAREKLQWASTRVTTVPEDIAYSLFGIFGVHLPIIYGETKQNALGRLLQKVIAQSGDITTLDWVGQPSMFNSCLPADIISYRAPPCHVPSLSEDEIESSVSSLRGAVTLEPPPSRLYQELDCLSPPRFVNRRLHLPCIVFRVADVRRRPGTGPDEETNAYEVKAYGLDDLHITIAHKLIQFSRAMPTQQRFLLVRPWDRRLLEHLDFAKQPAFASSLGNWSEPESPLQDSPPVSPVKEELDDSKSHSRALRLIVRLGQPFSAFLLAQQHGGEYMRIASDHDIIAQVKDVASVHTMMDIRTVEIL